MRKLLPIIILFFCFSFGESLWQGEKSGLFDDKHAKDVGDSITVLIVETVSNKQKNDSVINNDNSFSLGAGTGMLNLERTALPAKSAFKMKGEQKTEGEFKAKVTVKVVGVKPNGELLISGNKLTNINNEKQFIKVTGVIRPENIMEGNTVYSSHIGDAVIEYLQEGEVNNAAQPGMLTKIFNWIF